LLIALAITVPVGNAAKPKVSEGNVISGQQVKTNINIATAAYKLHIHDKKNAKN